jgi:hypothetical protein
MKDSKPNSGYAQHRYDIIEKTIDRLHVEKKGPPTE